MEPAATVASTLDFSVIQTEFMGFVTEGLPVALVLAAIGIGIAFVFKLFRKGAK